MFLITTSAGGQGITLTAANTVIIYDSAYNPQQDAQAIARAHRIGQTQEVTIYRFVADHTYEEKMVKIAGMKQGLDAVLLSNLSSGMLNAKEAKVIEKMLKEGAMALLEHGEQGDADAEALQGQSIFEILDKRSSKRILTSACQKGDVFSKVTIDSTAAVGQDAELTWEALLPEAVAQHERALKEAQLGQVVGPRIRKAINYNLTALGKRGANDADDEDYNAEEEAAASVQKVLRVVFALWALVLGGHVVELGGVDWTTDAWRCWCSGINFAENLAEKPTSQSNQSRCSQSKPKSASKGADGPRSWTKAEIKALEDALVCFGMGRPDRLQAAVPRRSADEIDGGIEVLMQIIRAYANMPKLPSNKENLMFGHPKWDAELPEGVTVPPSMHKVCALAEVPQLAMCVLLMVVYYVVVLVHMQYVT